MSRWRLFYHLVWATRGREPLITATIQPRIYRHLRQVAQQQQVLVHAIGGIDDHIHLAVSIPPSLAVAAVVARLKGVSTRMINEELALGFGWQSEYGVTSFAERHLPQVIAYIENQPEHHANGSLWTEVELG